MKIVKNCLNCGKEFEIYESELKFGKGKFCSLKCYWESLKGRIHKRNGKIITKNCLYCGKKFSRYIFPSELKRRKGKCCSHLCSALNANRISAESNRERHPKIIKKCICGKEFITSSRRKKFCSFQCFSKSKKGISPKYSLKGLFAEKSPSWKGGRTIVYPGYILIYSLTHPFREKKNYIFEHRLVAEQCLGRYLLKQEIIHHINGIPDDNRPENLFLFPSIGKHWKYHLLKVKPVLLSNII